MIDLSFISIPLIIVINTYFFLWIFLSIVYLTRKTEVDDPPLQDHFVSVILPARDEEKVIQNIIEDLKRQTYKNLEVIVVAHNCQDKTYEKALETSNPSEIPIKVCKLNTKEMGKGLALQHGLKQARGDLIAYFDSDNRVPPTFIEGMIEWIERGFDAVQTKMRAKNLESRLTFFQDMENVIFIPLFWGGKSKMGLNAGIGGTGIMVTRMALNKIGGFRNVLIEDFDVFIRLTLKSFRVAYADNCMVYDEKITDWKKLIKQRARWIAGHFELIFKYSLKDKLRLLFRDPIYFLQLFSPFCLLAQWLGILLFLVSLFLPVTYVYVPLGVWAVLTLIVNLLFAMIVRNEDKQNFRRMFINLPTFYLFSLHWYLAFIKSFFVHGWSDTKTEHGLERR